MKTRFFLPLALVLLLASGCAGQTSSAVPPAQASFQPAIPDASSLEAREELAGYLQDIVGADGKVFQAKDDRGNLLDTAKIIENPQQPGTFLAISHCYDSQGTARVNLACSTDLLHWTYVVTLAGEKGKNATQPTIYPVEQGFMVAWEQEPKNHIRLAYYDNWEALRTAQPSHTFDCPRLGWYAEGTPCIYSATSTSADIGFHYYKDRKADRQARGQMAGWKEWQSAAHPHIDQALLDYGIGGNIGDRDLLAFRGRDYLVIEGGGSNENFGEWRCFLYDCAAGDAIRLEMKTPGNSLAFANPTATLVRLQGKPALVCTVFIPSENSGPGEAGCCIYYHYITE